jgi:hypothetical protein
VGYAKFIGYGRWKLLQMTGGAAIAAGWPMAQEAAEKRPKKVVVGGGIGGLSLLMK